MARASLSWPGLARPSTSSRRVGTAYDTSRCLPLLRYVRARNRIAGPRPAMTMGHASPCRSAGACGAGDRAEPLMREGRALAADLLRPGQQGPPDQLALCLLLLCLRGRSVGLPGCTVPPAGPPSRMRCAISMRFAAGLVLMIAIAMVDIRFIARLAWPSYFVSLLLLVLVEATATSARVRSGGSRSKDCNPAVGADESEDLTGAGAGQRRGSTVPRGSVSAIRCS